MRSVFLRSLCAVIAASSWATIMLGCKKDPGGPGSAPAPEGVRIAYQPLTLALPLYVAQERGYFESEGVHAQITKYGGSGPMVEALVAGREDVVVGFALPNAYNVDLQSPRYLRILCLTVSNQDQGSSAILVRTDGGVDQIPHLRDKRMAFSPPGSTMRTFAHIILRANGLSPEDVTLLSMAPDTLQESLWAGQVDAVFTIQPYVSILKRSGRVGVLSDVPLNRYVVDPFPGVGIFVRRESFSGQPDLFAAVRRAFDRAIDDIRRDEAGARGAISRWTTLPEDLAAEIPLPTFLKSDEIDPTPIRRLAEILHEHGSDELPSVPPAENFLN